MSLTINGDFQPARPGSFATIVDINWQEPVTFRSAFRGDATSGDQEVFCAIVACHDSEWWVYAIEAVFRDDLPRVFASDAHEAKMARLYRNLGDLDFKLSLGAPYFHRRAHPREALGWIKEILVRAHWHLDMAATEPLGYVDCPGGIAIRNTGWCPFLEPEVALDIFCKGDRRHRPTPPRRGQVEMRLGGWPFERDISRRHSEA